MAGLALMLGLAALYVLVINPLVCSSAG